MCLLTIDTFSEIDIIEDDLFLGFIYLVDYPILPNSVFPETYQLTNFGQTTCKYARLPPTRSGLKMVQRIFTVRLRKDEETGYYAARCVELPEAISQGKTEEEAVTNLREALELVLEEYEAEARKEGGKLIPIIV
jgi:predicted RNase H-like HicB family nuclease